MRRNCGWLAVTWLLWSVKTFAGAAFSSFPPSPCPTFFNYEDVSSDGDSWYGVINVTTDITVYGLDLRVGLDRPSQLLVAWEGNVLSTDNTVYFIFNPRIALEAGKSKLVKIMVRFDPNASFTPFLQTIHISGRRACPPDLPLTLSVAGDPDEASSVVSRPDPETLEPTDVWSERSTVASSARNVSSSPPPPATTLKCGQVDVVTPLVTHGAITHRGQWPWHVALYKTEGVNLNYKCGGTLVSKNKVITAAHCVTNSQGKAINSSSVILFLGKYRLEQFVDEEGVQIKQVSRIYVHPGYNVNNYYGDIAIVALSADTEYTSYVRPICLWESTPTIVDVVGKTGSVVGWGLDESDQTTKDLRVAHMPVVSLETCLRSFPQFYSQFTSNSSFCAGFRNGTGPCNGDSGGGLVFSRNSTWFLRGIVSLSVAREGLNFCDSRFYVILTDVAKFTDFISRYVP